MSKAAELASLIGNINAGGGTSNKNLFISDKFLIFRAIAKIRKRSEEDVEKISGR